MAPQTAAPAKPKSPADGSADHAPSKVDGPKVEGAAPVVWPQTPSPGSLALSGSPLATHPGGRAAPVELSAESLAFAEELYEAWLQNPSNVTPDWQAYFASQPRVTERAQLGPSFPKRSLFHAVSVPTPTFGSKNAEKAASDQERVDQMIRNFRVRGHAAAKIDPLEAPRSVPMELNPEFYGFTEADYDKPCSTIRSAGPDVRTLRQVVDWLRNTYCRTIGVQFMHIDSLTTREWLLNEMESTENRLRITRDTQMRILKRLTDATTFEEFIAKRFPGKKAFSLQGAESLIPLLDMAIEQAGEDGVQEVVIGMAHRGRLNVLANIAGKKPREIFREFKDMDAERHVGKGDVKYHLGYDSQWVTQTEKQVHISLCVNPSHLEFVNPVATGRMRAKIDRMADGDPSQGLVILIHGDAALPGEGVVQETLNLSELKGYSVGGTVHVVVNNQVGFTTDPEDARSSQYSTDIFKMLQVPIFHVNGEDPEAVAQTIKLAMGFRKKFQKDVVIDMYCYRLRGHNEGDEPEFTQPRMYRKIKAKKTVRDTYVENLVNLGGISRAEADRIREFKDQQLDEEYKAATTNASGALPVETMQGLWAGYSGGPEAQSGDPETGLPVEQLQGLLRKQLQLPDGFTPHPGLKKFVLTARAEMAEGTRNLDWGAAESLAFGSLLESGVPIRMSGQDVRRGTFSHRHATLVDYETGNRWTPLQHLSDNQAPFHLYNSPLSEIGVLGFEYGYSTDCPAGLILWEAQFGDFVNCAQVIIDQFIVSGEEKWRRLSGVTMLLPHGFEGSGPEHSSARLERFLEGCANDNVQVVMPSTPAQYFHLLRRQVLRKWRKPLIVMTPKSLLRMPASSLADCAKGTFQRVIADDTPPAASVTKVLLCSGKIYFELLKRREESGRGDVAIVRVEQFYPLPTESLKMALKGYTDGIPAIHVQEEPENMGAWRFLKAHYGEKLLGRFPFSGIHRKAGGTPATGSTKSHEMEQESLLAAAFKG
jgi:2-oxoglutarate dehydrogenase E1 component